MQQQNPYNQRAGQPMIPPPQIASRMPMYQRIKNAGMQGFASYFPQQYSTYAIVAYFVGLFGVAMMASSANMVMEWYWWVFGIVEVLGFFLFSSYLSKRWGRLKRKTFERRLFLTGFTLRAIVVLFLYWFFYTMKGDYLMFGSSDEVFYIDMSTFGAARLRDGHWGTFISDLIDETGGKIDTADMGYPTFLSLIFYLTNDSIIFSRLVNALLGAYTSVLVYRFANRNFGEVVGRMSAIFCMLMPNLIYYCGINLKEIVMIFLLILFAESGDRLLRQQKHSLRIYILPLTSALILFTFRNVLGAAAIMSLAIALFLTDERTSRLSRRWVVLILLVIIGSYFIGGKMYMELEQVWEQRHSAQETRLEDRSKKGNILARNAGAAVFAPMIFTLPFPTMIETEGQETFRMIHGGVVVKNIMSGFSIFAVFILLLEGGLHLQAKWREHVLLLALLGGYLLILTFSAFAHAERFHLPAVPLELILAAYGVTKLKPKNKYMYTIWCVIMIAAMIGWNWFKLRGRGMI